MNKHIIKGIVVNESKAISIVNYKFWNLIAYEKPTKNGTKWYTKNGLEIAEYKNGILYIRKEI